MALNSIRHLIRSKPGLHHQPVIIASFSVGIGKTEKQLRGRIPERGLVFRNGTSKSATDVVLFDSDNKLCLLASPRNDCFVERFYSV